MRPDVLGLMLLSTVTVCTCTYSPKPCFNSYSTLTFLPYSFSLGLVYSPLFLVSCSTILLIAYLTNHPSSFSDSLYGIELIIALIRCFTVCIFLSTTATASPAPVLPRMIPRLLLLLLQYYLE